MTDTRPDGDITDVVVSSPLPIANIDFARDSYHAPAIIKHLDLSTPWTRDSILDFFEFQAQLKDQLAVAERIEIPQPRTKDGKPIPSVTQSKLTATMREFIAMEVNKGTPSGIIRGEIERIYGVVVSASHMSHMRKRVFKKQVNL